MPSTRSVAPTGRLWRVWLALGLVYSAAYFLFDASVQGWLLLAANLASGVAVIVGAKLNRPTSPAPWYLFGSGLIVYGLGNVIWFTENLILHSGQSIVHASNLFFAAGYALMAASLVASLRRRNPAQFTTLMGDALISVAGTAVLWWVLLIQPIATEPSLSPFGQFASFLYPFFDVVLLALLGALLQVPSPRSGPQRMIVAGVALMLVADGIYYWYAIENSFSLGGVPDALWLVSYVLYGAATLHKGSVAASTEARDHNRITRGRLAYFVGASLIGPVALGIETLRGKTVSMPVFVASSVVLFLLVLFRMAGLLRRVEAASREGEEQRAALTASETRYRSLVESINEIIFQIDLEGRWTFLSPAWERLSGYSIEESIGARSLDSVHGEDRSRIGEAIRRVMSEEAASVRASVRLRARDGSVRWVEAVASPLCAGAGSPIGLAGTLEDITERKLAERALEEAEERYRTLVEQIPAVVYIDTLDPNVTGVYVSPRLEELVGFTPEEWHSLSEGTWVGRVHPEDRERVLAERSRVAEEGDAFELEYRFRHKDGGWLWLHDEAILIRDGEGRRLYLQGLVGDITDRKQLEGQLRHQAFHDPLTDLANRELFFDRVQHALTRLDRHSEQVAVMFIDLDNFKHINDSFGHAAGDALLRDVAERLTNSLRPSDTAARLGGDEFAVLLEDTNRGGAVSVAERILASFQDPFAGQEGPVLMNGSIGIALSSERNDASDLLRCADTAMYEAKNRGRARFEVFEARMESGAKQRLELHTDLKRALECDEIVMHYQPIFRLDPVEVVGIEALVRWQHPTRGMISPADFIPIAEDTGLIIPLGQLVLEKTCAQVARWERELNREFPLRVGANVSGRQLQQPSIVKTVAHALDRHHLDPGNFVIEITESVLMHDPDEVASRLHQLRDLGLHVAIDDFGTGYSSLSYLRRFPAEILKVDRYFVQRMDGDPEESSYAAAIVRLGHSLGLDVVAEGIERPGELAELRAAGCDFGQGFMLARPAPAEELTGLLSGRVPVKVA
ncbi:MAG: putative bifunctional diguanylate cyclase/phosphodiesterase [Actinomycetota bacterium]